MRLQRLESPQRLTKSARCSSRLAHTSRRTKYGALRYSFWHTEISRYQEAPPGPVNDVACRHRRLHRKYSTAHTCTLYTTRYRRLCAALRFTPRYHLLLLGHGQVCFQYTRVLRRALKLVVLSCCDYLSMGLNTDTSTQCLPTPGILRHLRQARRLHRRKLIHTHRQAQGLRIHKTLTDVPLRFRRERILGIRPTMAH
jgi:hypothetical protein